jgi:hypothetical protein
MFRFTKNIENYGQEVFKASKYIGQGFGVTFNHMNRQPITVHYPYGEDSEDVFILNLINVLHVKFVYAFVQLIFLLLIGNIRIVLKRSN